MIPSRGELDLEFSRSYNAQAFSELSDWLPEPGAGSWSIEQGQYSGQGDRSISITSWADLTLTLDAQTISAGAQTYDTAWVNFRYSDEDNRYYCLIHKTGEVELAKVQNGTPTFIYDGANLLAETDAAGVILVSYLHSPRIDEPLEMINSSSRNLWYDDGQFYSYETQNVPPYLQNTAIVCHCLSMDGHSLRLRSK